VYTTAGNGMLEIYRNFVNPTGKKISDGLIFSLLHRPVTRGVGAGGRPPVRRQKRQKVRLVSQVKESIGACNKIKIVLPRTQSLRLYCMNKVGKIAMKLSYLILKNLSKFLPIEVRF